MIAMFAGTWAYVIAVILLQVVVRPPDAVVQFALIPVIFLVAGGVWLQFSVRCPSCGVRLGRQSRLIVPERCRACGVSLRRPQDAR